MYKQLKEIFPSVRFYKSAFIPLDHEYEWFLGENDEYIGILKTELTEKDRVLLKTFLKPVHGHFPPLTNKEQWWQQILHDKQPNDDTSSKRIKFRLIYFQFPEKRMKPILFKDAMKHFFQNDIIILWENNHSGLLIEESQPNSKLLNFKEIIHVLMSDLYVNLRFLVGPLQTNYLEAPFVYNQIKRFASLAFKYNKDPVISLIDILPAIMIENSNKTLIRKLIPNELIRALNNQEIKRIILTLIECNLNISHTAKQLYMHRNSLLYRLDRFSEQTGLDIRYVHDAWIVYLSLMILN
ncbi:sugar diacid utilization regulator [Cerasibacillus quisquiliarum]|uniref:PucR C-terminal helix-turn-helix domain-containing protein n=1 Tax=Cerasibacillus quisquiliarum TaxID=227865 RepID=A0A511UVT5_9BACI|nr:helix-turn-helix domain-containing protein [Cerasibacillus quisquiliarum]MBB5146409.1 sugar diacid utilization regulator [Cerasibacillus quisquiliarum]GEN30736.1 hypothetical protein CQU01_09740 [Cerasibacillus quisquiliarum]